MKKPELTDKHIHKHNEDCVYDRPNKLHERNHPVGALKLFLLLSVAGKYPQTFKFWSPAFNKRERDPNRSI